MKFSGKVGNGPLKKWLNFGGDPDHRLHTGIVFRIRHYWEIRKAINGHSLVLIHQMAALVRRSLAEVCTVPLLLVYTVALRRFAAVPTRITSGATDATLLSPMIARFPCHVTSDPSTSVHVTWSRGSRQVVLDGRRVYKAPDGSLVVNATAAEPEVARSSLGAMYTCHVTNGMTSDRRQVRLAYDVIGGAPLSWMSINSVTGICIYIYTTIRDSAAVWVMKPWAVSS